MDYQLPNDQQTIDNIIARIDSLRSAKGFSIGKLAVEAEISENTLKHIYKRKTCPTIPILHRICMAFDMTLSQFFSFDMSDTGSAIKERELIKSFQDLSPEHQDLVLYVTKKI